MPLGSGQFSYRLRDEEAFGGICKFAPDGRTLLTVTHKQDLIERADPMNRHIEDILRVYELATGKERLGDKASDNQRVNDCRVPPEKRGPSKRPTECAQK